MTKTVRVVFDGKTFVPDDAEGVPVGASFDFNVEVTPRKTGLRAMEILQGTITDQQAEDMLEAIKALDRIGPPISDKFKE